MVHPTQPRTPRQRMVEANTAAANTINQQAPTLVGGSNLGALEA